MYYTKHIKKVKGIAMNTVLIIWGLFGVLSVVFALLMHKRTEKITLERQLIALDEEECEKMNQPKPVPAGDMEYAEWVAERYGFIYPSFLEAYGHNEEFMQRINVAISKNKHPAQWLSDFFDDRENGL